MDIQSVIHIRVDRLVDCLDSLVDMSKWHNRSVRLNNDYLLRMVMDHMDGLDVLDRRLQVVHVVVVYTTLMHRPCNPVDNNKRHYG